MGPRIRALGVPVMALGMHVNRPSVRGVRNLSKAARAFRPNVIQGWMYHGNLAACMARVLVQGRPALAWNIRHSLYDLKHEKRMTRQVIRANRFFSSMPDAILYNSCLSREQHEAFGYQAERAQIIPNGFDLGRFAPSAQTAALVRKALGIPLDALVVGHVARLHPMKDHAGFLRAAAQVATRHQSVHFVLGGRGVVQQNESLIQLLPREIRGRFHFLGERSDVPDLMCAMDIFCQSSWSEAFPNVLGEAMATAVPCVATDVGDSADIVGDTGVIVPPKNADALVAGLEKVLRMPVEERQALGMAGRARAEQRYSLNAVVATICAALRKSGNRTAKRRKAISMNQVTNTEQARFGFGDNWARYLVLVDDDRISAAEQSLKDMLEVSSLEGQRFLDAGSGSGLFSLAARNLGATVHSFDYDTESVGCTQALKARYWQDDTRWRVERGDVLDGNYLGALGTFDVVYSWGVLHHTGDMWRALGNVVPLVREGGALFLALYNDQRWLSKYWKHVKRTYNRGVLGRWSMIAVHAPYFMTRQIGRTVLSGSSRRRRGMDPWRDIRDWLGGYPFEVARPEDVLRFYREHGFTLERMTTVGGRHGCNEFVLRRKPSNV